MTTYVMLANWTDQGALKVKELATSSGRGQESPQRYERRVQALFPHHGTTMTSSRIYEAPDDAVAARFSLQLGMIGKHPDAHAESIS